MEKALLSQMNITQASFRKEQQSVQIRLSDRSLHRLNIWLEMVLMEYLSEETAVQNIPVLRMIATPLEEIEKEARSFVRILRHTGMDAKIQMVSCESQIGGGSLPLERMESRAVAIQPNGMSVAEMEEKMRHLEIPIIPRTINDSICLDVRTIERKDYKMIAAELAELLGKKEER